MTEKTLANHSFRKYVEKAVEGYFATSSGGDVAILHKMVERHVKQIMDGK